MKLLKELFKIYSPSGNEKKMRKFIKWWIKNNVPEATVTTDPIGNIYVVKGNPKHIPVWPPTLIKSSESIARTLKQSKPRITSLASPVKTRGKRAWEPMISVVFG